MNALPSIVGVLAFIASRLIVITLIALSTGRFGWAQLPGQLQLGFLAGLVVSPFAFQLFRSKWPRIWASAAGAALFGIVAAAISKIKNHTPTDYILGLFVAVGCIWFVCGFLAGWLTVEVLSRIETRRKGPSHS